MALQAAYLRFLASPSSSFLADDAAIYYITTTTVFQGATEIIKHLASQRKQLSKKKEEVLNAIESQDGLAIELDTTVKFVTGGSAYLPALDDNFLADRIVHMPVFHIVSFNAQGKIVQIRQSWDQGALLKQIDVIGRSGRNWPIRDGSDQSKMIATAVGAAKDSHAAAAAAAPTALLSRPRDSKTARGSQASLELFASREELENEVESVVAPYAGVRPPRRDIDEIFNPGAHDDGPDTVVSPYAGRRPRQRSFTEIIGDNDDDEDDDGTTDTSYDRSSRMRSRSPSKVIAPKAGVAKKFQPVRLFNTDDSVDSASESPEDEKKPQSFYRPNPKKYNHFDFADGSDPQDVPQAGPSFDEIPKTKHNSQWSFDDFTTPQKPIAKVAHGQQVRHWTADDGDLPKTPPAASRKPAFHRIRSDAETHFELRDDGESPPGASRARERRLRGAGHNEGLRLYENNLYKEDGSAPTPEARALDAITNHKDRHKTFESHFSMADVSPSRKAPAKPVNNERQKVVRMVESSWATTITDDASSNQKENIPGTIVAADQPDRRGIQTAGDGMGGKKMVFNGDKDSRGIQIAGDGMGGRKTATANQENVNRGIQTAGDGMGGKKSGRSWSFGDGESEPEEEQPAPVRKQNKSTMPTGFWDF